MTARHVARDHALMIALYSLLGRRDLADIELVRLTSWIFLQQGTGGEKS